jgi:hypothetical protein
MIDPLTETVITLSDGMKTIPRGRGGKRRHVSCAYRWTTIGCRGVVLESIQIGGTRCTSLEALARFFQRLTTARTGVPASTRTPKQRERDIQQAEREIDDGGVRHRLTTARTGVPASTRTPKQRERDIQQAEREIDDDGIRSR